MSISNELMYAILAMDAYNQGYSPGVSGIGVIARFVRRVTLDMNKERTLAV